MDFDEYEYLENQVENPGVEKLESKANGGDEVEESEEKGRSRSSKHRNGDDVDRPSKRLRSEKESRDSERDRRSHRSSRDRDRGEKDKHRSTREHRDRDKEEGRGMEKDRERDRARDTEKDRERGSDKKRDGNKERVEREYERERDWEGERDRSRSNRNHPERYHDVRGRENNRELENTDNDFKERRKGRDFRDRDHDNRKNKEKKEEESPPDPERDQRTVFAYQIPLKAAERDIYEFFSRAGKVRDVRLITDRNTGRSRGVGYVEFVDVMSVPMAIALSGQPLCGHPLMVKPSEAEKNLVQSTAAASGGGGALGPYSGGARRLYVGNLPVTIKEDQLRQVFEPFGAVELVQMPVDLGTGNCKGYAFVQFARLEDSKLAQNLNGQLEIGGRVIKVSAITDQAGMEEAGANLADLDDDEGNGLSLNAHSRALLMQKLDRTGASASINASFGAPAVDSHGVSMPQTAVPGQNFVPSLPGLATAAFSVATSPIDTIGVPSECLLLKNMFDPNSEVEPDFELDIKEDVQEECSKFGAVKHIHVDKNTAGFVYLRFDNTQAAMAAQRALHGRWFAGKMITATFLLPHDYEAKFPNS